MDTMKKFAKYVLLVIGGYLLTGLLIFIGFNVNYSEISIKDNLPEQITIAKAEATSKQGRIYGYVSNSEENNVNGKYIKISVYDSNNEILTTEYLKIQDVEYDKEKLFKSKFTANDVSSYSISIVDEETK